MATGDAAAAAGMDVVDGATTPANTTDTEINLTRDYIANGAGAVSAATANKVVKRDANGRASFATPTASGHAATKGYVDPTIADVAAATAAPDADTLMRRGTGGRVNVGDPSAPSNAATKGYVDALGTELATPDTVMRRSSTGRVNVGDPVSSANAATKGYVDDKFSSVSADADKVTSAAYSREAGSSRYAMWMDGSRNIGRSSSSRRRKNDITPHTFDLDALLSIPVVSFIRDVDADTGTRDIGLIAEDLADAGLTELVFTDDEGRVDGIHDHRIVYALLATVQDLSARLAALEAGA